MDEIGNRKQKENQRNQSFLLLGENQPSAAVGQEGRLAGALHSRGACGCAVSHREGSPRSLCSPHRLVLVVGSSCSCFGRSRCVLCSSPETQRLHQRLPGPLGLGRVPRWPLSWEVNTERCRGDRPWDRGVTEGRVPRLGSGPEREQSRPRVVGSPAEALSPMTMTVGAECQEEPAVRGASSLQRGSQSDRK